MRAIGYFKTTAGRRCGSEIVERYLKVMPDGNIITIDATRKKISICKSFGGLPYQIESSTGVEWRKQYKKMEKSWNP